MNYWLLTTEYPPMHGGGISTYCYFTARMLASSGYRVTVFTQDDSVRDYFISAEAENIRLIKFSSNRNKLHASLGYTARLAYAFAGMVKLMIEKEGKPDVIESQDYLGIAYYLTQFKHTGYPFLLGVPILLTLHSPAFIYLEYNRVPTYRYPDFWTGEMEKQAIVAADGLISPSHFLVAEIRKHIAIDEKKLAVIANPYQNETHRTTDFKRNKIVYYGKLSPQKGSFELLAYFKELWDDEFKHPLHVIGGMDIVYHPEVQTMGQLVKDKYASYIEKGLLVLHGKIKPEQINESIRDAHVIIVPSIVDNMPYVVMEAMSIGKIVLASIQGGQREMIEDGVSGFLFDHNEPASFGEQLIKILSLNNESLQRISISACQRVHDDYSFEKVMQEKRSFLEQIIKDKQTTNQFPFLHQQEIKPNAKTSSAPGLLSVVVPFYNMGKYIEECVESVNKSTYKDIELLIINDGSTDSNSIEKLRLLSSQKNITVIDQPNKGLAKTRNYGAAIAKGTYLSFLDADDKVAATYFEKAIHALIRNDNVFFVGSWVQYFENSQALWPTFTPQPPYALVHNPINSSGLVYKRNAFLAGGLNDEKVDYGLEDYESVIQMLHNGFNGVVLPEVLFYYRVRTGSMIRNISNQKLLYSNKYITEKHSAYYTKFAVQIINLLNANGPGHLYDNPTFEINVSIKPAFENMLFFKLKNFVKKNDRLKRIALTLKKY